MRPFGYHIAGGINIGSSLHFAIRVQEFSAAQIFLGPPQQFKTSNIPAPEKLLFSQVKEQHGCPVFVHAPYVLHAFAKPENAKRNNVAIRDAMSLAGELGCDGYVLHTGGTKWYESSQYEDVLTILLNVCKDQIQQVPLLLENCASGNTMSGDLDIICNKIDRFRSRGWNIGLCLDTCHAWAFGYDYMEKEVLDHLIETVKPYLKLIHLNSMPAVVKCGSKYDRHAPIHGGVIPPVIFEHLLEALPGVPCIAERDAFIDALTELRWIRAMEEANAYS